METINLMWVIIGFGALLILSLLGDLSPKRPKDKWRDGFNAAEAAIEKGEDPKELICHGPADQWDRGWNFACTEEIRKNLKTKHNE